MEIVIDGPIPVDRDDIEDALNESGLGEVNGAGTGMGVAHLDFEVNPAAHRATVLTVVFDILDRLAVGDAVRVRAGDGDFWIRQSEWRSDRSA